MEATNISMAAANSTGQPIYVLIIATTFYSILIAVGCIGNISVIWVICNHHGMKNSYMNIYILNMSIADLTLNLSGIPDVVQLLRDMGWTIGMVACKGFRYIMVTSLYVSILCLLAISIER